MNTDPLITRVFRVPILQIPAQDLQRIVRRFDLGQSDSHLSKYIRPVTEGAIMNSEYDYVRVMYEASGAKAAHIGTNFEAKAIALNQTPSWNGSLCTVGKTVKQMIPVPHSPKAELTYKADEWVASLATMNFRHDDKKGWLSELKVPMGEGPMSAIVTKQSIARYNLEMTMVLAPKVGPVSGTEQFAEAVYDTIYKMNNADKNRLLESTYGLFAKAEITIPPEFKVGEQASVGCSKLVEMDWKGCRLNNPKKKRDGMTPIGVIKGAKFTADIVSKMPGVGKDVCNIAISNMLSSFPPKMMIFNSFMGNPAPAQRDYMDIRPLLEIAKIEDPSVNMLSWMKPNGQGDRVTFTDDRRYEFPAGDSPVIISRPYTGVIHKTKAINWGAVHFDALFWSEYEIVTYRIFSKAYFFYASKSLKLNYPSEWCGRSLCRATSAAEFLKLIQTFTSNLIGMYLKGSYWPNPKQYEKLKYPNQDRQVQRLEVTSITEEARTNLNEEITGIQPFKLGILEEQAGEETYVESEAEDFSYPVWASGVAFEDVDFKDPDEWVNSGHYAIITASIWKQVCKESHRYFGQSPEDSGRPVMVDGYNIEYVGTSQGNRVFSIYLDDESSVEEGSGPLKDTSYAVKSSLQTKVTNLTTSDTISSVPKSVSSSAASPAGGHSVVKHSVVPPPPLPVLDEEEADVDDDSPYDALNY